MTTAAQIKTFIYGRLVQQSVVHKKEFVIDEKFGKFMEKVQNLNDGEPYIFHVSEGKNAHIPEDTQPICEGEFLDYKVSIHPLNAHIISKMISHGLLHENDREGYLREWKKFDNPRSR